MFEENRNDNQQQRRVHVILLPLISTNTDYTFHMVARHQCPILWGKDVESVLILLIAMRHAPCYIHFDILGFKNNILWKNPFFPLVHQHVRDSSQKTAITDNWDSATTQCRWHTKPYKIYFLIHRNHDLNCLLIMFWCPNWKIHPNSGTKSNGAEPPNLQFINLFGFYGLKWRIIFFLIHQHNQDHISFSRPSKPQVNYG